MFVFKIILIAFWAESHVLKNQNSNNKISEYTNKPSEVKKRQTACPDDGIHCIHPVEYRLTSEFICYDDCPKGYLCCEDSCFMHRICKPVASLDINKPIKALCPNEEITCRVPLPASEWNHLACQDGGCPSGYKCCSDSCFYFKVCKKVEEMELDSTIYATDNKNQIFGPTFLPTEAFLISSVDELYNGKSTVTKSHFNSVKNDVDNVVSTISTPFPVLVTTATSSLEDELTTIKKQILSSVSSTQIPTSRSSNNVEELGTKDSDNEKGVIEKTTNSENDNSFASTTVLGGINAKNSDNDQSLSLITSAYTSTLIVFSDNKLGNGKNKDKGGKDDETSRSSNNVEELGTNKSDNENGVIEETTKSDNATSFTSTTVFGGTNAKNNDNDQDLSLITSVYTSTLIPVSSDDNKLEIADNKNEERKNDETSRSSNNVEVLGTKDSLDENRVIEETTKSDKTNSFASTTVLGGTNAKNSDNNDQSLVLITSVYTSTLILVSSDDNKLGIGEKEGKEGKNEETRSSKGSKITTEKTETDFDYFDENIKGTTILEITNQSEKQKLSTPITLASDEASETTLVSTSSNINNDLYINRTLTPTSPTLTSASKNLKTTVSTSRILTSVSEDQGSGEGDDDEYDSKNLETSTRVTQSDFDFTEDEFGLNISDSSIENKDTNFNLNGSEENLSDNRVTSLPITSSVNSSVSFDKLDSGDSESKNLNEIKSLEEGSGGDQDDDDDVSKVSEPTLVPTVTQSDFDFIEKNFVKIDTVLENTHHDRKGTTKLTGLTIEQLTFGSPKEKEDDNHNRTPSTVTALTSAASDVSFIKASTKSELEESPVDTNIDNDIYISSVYWSTTPAISILSSEDNKGNNVDENGNDEDNVIEISETTQTIDTKTSISRILTSFSDHLVSGEDDERTDERKVTKKQQNFDSIKEKWSSNISHIFSGKINSDGTDNRTTLSPVTPTSVNSSFSQFGSLEKIQKTGNKNPKISGEYVKSNKILKLSENNVPEVTRSDFNFLEETDEAKLKKDSSEDVKSDRNSIKVASKIFSGYGSGDDDNDDDNDKIN